VTDVDLPLEREQVELFCRMVEAQRNLPRERRTKFLLVKVMGTRDPLIHPGFPRDIGVYEGDLEVLESYGLLYRTYGSKGGLQFDITPEGYRTYEQLKKGEGLPAERIGIETRAYLEGSEFRSRYSVAYDKWAEAEGMLWSAEAKDQLTLIGHLIREAMQAFASSLVEMYRPPDVTADKSRDINRLRGVVAHVGPKLSESVRLWLDSLANAWASASALAQRQEHGGQKEGRTLVWEDARRAVFAAAFAMFEIDRTLSAMK
jgi:hypothetical protein